MDIDEIEDDNEWIAEEEEFSGVSDRGSPRRSEPAGDHERVARHQGCSLI
jgi:hypothetical protein